MTLQISVATDHRFVSIQTGILLKVVVEPNNRKNSDKYFSANALCKLSFMIHTRLLIICLLYSIHAVCSGQVIDTGFLIKFESHMLHKKQILESSIVYLFLSKDHMNTYQTIAIKDQSYKEHVKLIRRVRRKTSDYEEIKRTYFQQSNSQLDTALFTLIPHDLLYFNLIYNGAIEIKPHRIPCVNNDNRWLHYSDFTIENNNIIQQFNSKKCLYSITATKVKIEYHYCQYTDQYWYGANVIDIHYLSILDSEKAMVKTLFPVKLRRR